MDGVVLVLNQNYEPLNVCNVRRAFILLDHGKAEMLEEGEGILRGDSVKAAIDQARCRVGQTAAQRQAGGDESQGFA